MLAFASFAQVVLRAAADNVNAVCDEEIQELNEAELTWLAANDGEQDHAEGLLHLRHLEKLVEDDFRLLVALHFDDDAHAFAVALIANVRDAFDFLVVDEFGDVLDEIFLVHLIRQFGDDDVLAILAALFDGCLGPHLEAAAASFIGLLDAFAAVDVACGGEVRTGNDFHYLLEG